MYGSWTSSRWPGRRSSRRSTHLRTLGYPTRLLVSEATSSSSAATTASASRLTSSSSTSVCLWSSLLSDCRAHSPRSVTLAWETRNSYGQAPSPRGYHATTLQDSRLVVIGGFDGSSVYDSAYCLELAGSAFLPQITNFVLSPPAPILSCLRTDIVFGRRQDHGSRF